MRKQYYGRVERLEPVSKKWVLLTPERKIEDELLIEAIKEEIDIHQARPDDLRITVTKETTVHSLKICNMCGFDMSDGIYKDESNHDPNFGLRDAEVYGRYDSPVLFDRTKCVFSLCEYCLVWLFESFAVPQTVIDLDGDNISTWHREMDPEETSRRSQARSSHLKR